MGGFSSNKVTKESIPLAYFARVWEGLFPRHCTCRTWNDLKSYNLWKVSEMKLAMETRGEAKPKRAWETMHESPLKRASQISISQAKSTASSIAFASISVDPRGNGICLINTAITKASWSWITTPIPTKFVGEKMVALVFTLYHGGVGGTQQLSMVSLYRDGLRWVSWNSSKR